MNYRAFNASRAVPVIHIIDAPDRALSLGTLALSHRCCLPTSLINHRVHLISAHGPELCNYAFQRSPTFSLFHTGGRTQRGSIILFFTQQFTVRASSAVFFARFARGGINSRANEKSHRSSFNSCFSFIRRSLRRTTRCLESLLQKRKVLF